MNMNWDERFLVLRPTAATVFATAFANEITRQLQEQGLDSSNIDQVRAVRPEAFKATVAKSSSLPVRDQFYWVITLHCSIWLLAFYHPYGKDIDRTLKAFGWTDHQYSRYFSLLRRHGISI